MVVIAMDGNAHMLDFFVVVHVYNYHREDADILDLVYRPGYFTVHPPPAPSGPKFSNSKIVAGPKMQCHQKSFGIWRVTEAILGQKTCFFSKNIFWKKFIINHTIFLIFRCAFFRY